MNEIFQNAVKRNGLDRNVMPGAIIDNPRFKTLGALSNQEDLKTKNHAEDIAMQFANSLGYFKILREGSVVRHDIHSDLIFCDGCLIELFQVKFFDIAQGLRPIINTHYRRAVDSSGKELSRTINVLEKDKKTKYIVDDIIANFKRHIDSPEFQQRTFPLPLSTLYQSEINIFFNHLRNSRIMQAMVLLSTIFPNY